MTQPPEICLVLRLPRSPSVGCAEAESLAQDCLKKYRLHPGLGIEATWRIEIVDFPSFIVVDDRGNDFFVKFQG